MTVDEAARAELALLIEVGSSPKPGNVEPGRGFDDTSYHQFQAAAVGSREGLEAAADDVAVGEAFHEAVAGSGLHSGGNAFFGALLLLTPLVKAAAEDTVEDVESVVEETTVEDAAEFYRAFGEVDVNLGGVEPGGLPDAGEPEAAAEETLERELPLYTVMEESADVDDVAAEWSTGFGRVYRRADDLKALVDDGCSTVDAVATVYLDMLRSHPDSHVARVHGEHVAEDVVSMANNLDVNALDRRLRYDDVNPGATADVLAAAVYVALERGELGV